ncbi:FAD-dependent oxidoreductase [Inmirania thermothiophila]|uniref:Glycerol-3-phosphate dehydrogenase n=1 Tax=Inmirania thermothiophila TaxID=1750597 RepID=A0A3N1XWD9_9GAMM|nr:FAD-dependent oxidoreductase [Inmirania thermothiophila]ROR29512.1 glycerol-3-phosphate dehydrogenase [Inmirania thermothiophila]
MSDGVDLVVVGAGIQGAGIAWLAAASGHRVLVLERMPAPALGTSSRSTKLVHGGLRYLETGQWRLVREALRERAWLLRQAPALVRRLPMRIPVYAGMRRRPWQIRAGLALYALLGGLGPDLRFCSLPAAEATAEGLAGDGLCAAFAYLEAQTDDAALTTAVLAAATAHGARVLHEAALRSAAADRDGVVVRWRGGEVRARALAVAAGPWTAQVLRRLDPAPALPPLELVQGTHLLLAGRLDAGYYLEAADGRAVFALPWGGETLVGTTETPYAGDPAACRPLPAEVAYLRAAFGRRFPRRPAEVLGAFAGLRVLPGGDAPAFRRPRETLVGLAGRPVRIAVVAGGKLTTFRATARRVLAGLAPALGPPPGAAALERLRLEPAPVTAGLAPLAPMG